MIGAGLVLARFRFGHARFMERQDPMLRWFAMDGYGFFDGFFRWRRSVTEHRPPRGLHGYRLRAYDQGLGRSFWFATGADVDRIVATVVGYPQPRQGDLWSGVGLACAYAAGVMDRSAIDRLRVAAGDHAADLAVGNAVAASFRDETDHPAPHTDLACEVVWGPRMPGPAAGGTADAVAEIARSCRRGLPDGDAADTAYEVWRDRLRSAWVTPGATSGARRPVVEEVGA